jgi:predicted nucleic acid-binding Zn ribbon protein
MPKYVYQGLETGVTFELDQRISEAALTHHPETGEPVKRLIGRPAIAFKGSGFYANDSKGSSSSTKSSSSSESKSDSATDTSSSATATTSSPAPASSTTSD